MLESRPVMRQAREEGWWESDCPVLLRSRECASPAHLCAECEAWSRTAVEGNRGYRISTWILAMGSTGLFSEVPAVTAVAHYFTDLV